MEIRAPSRKRPRPAPTWSGSRARVAILLGPDGTVIRSYEVSDAAGHPDAALADLE